MKSPGSGFEKEPVIVWLIPYAWCKVKYNVIVGGVDWAKGEEIGHMTMPDVQKAFGGSQYRIQEVDSHGICPSCADKVVKQK